MIYFQLEGQKGKQVIIYQTKIRMIWTVLQNFKKSIQIHSNNPKGQINPKKIKNNISLHSTTLSKTDRLLNKKITYKIINSIYMGLVKLMIKKQEFQRPLKNRLKFLIEITLAKIN